MLKVQKEQGKEIEKQNREFQRKQEEHRKEIEATNKEMLQEREERESEIEAKNKEVLQEREKRINEMEAQMKKQEEQQKEIQKLTAVEHTNYMAGVTMENKLSKDIIDIQVVFAVSDKGTHMFSYMFNYACVDVEENHHIASRITVDFNLHGVKVIGPGCSSIVNQQIPFPKDTRHYWQVYFSYNGSKYKLNKNNAQDNAKQEDHKQHMKIIIEEDSNKDIFFRFKMKSGNTWFWAEEI